MTNFVYGMEYKFRKPLSCDNECRTISFRMGASLRDGEQQRTAQSRVGNRAFAISPCLVCREIRTAENHNPDIWNFLHQDQKAPRNEVRRLYLELTFSFYPVCSTIYYPGG